MKARFFLALLMGFFLFSSSPVYADCTNPAGVAGNQIYNSTYNIMQFCNGSLWVGMGAENGGIWLQSGSNIYYDTGNVGIGVNNPSVALEISGSATISNNLKVTSLASGLIYTDETGIFRKTSTLQAVYFPALTGDVTTSSGSLATTIADNAVTASKLASDSVTNAKMADDAVGSSEIIDNSITNAKMADSSVGTAEIIDSAVTSSKLFDGAVDTVKIADTAVTSDKLAIDSVTNAKILDNTITVGKLTGGTSGQAIISNGAGNAASWGNLTLDSLSDVVATTPVTNDFLRFDGTNWINQAISLSTQSRSMLPGWPDAIKCNTTTFGVVAFFPVYYGYIFNGLYYYKIIAAGADYTLVYKPDGSYNSAGGFTPGADCASKSITQLYAEGKAFDLVGGDGTYSVYELADTTISGLASGDVLSYDGSAWINQQPIWLLNGTNAYYNGGNVGVGTNAPASKLDVEGGVAIGETYSGTTAAPTNGAIIEGNVGIGTNAPATKLDVVGQVRIQDGTQGDGKVLTSAADGTASWQTPASGGAAGWSAYSTNYTSLSPSSWVTLTGLSINFTLTKAATVMVSVVGPLTYYAYEPSTNYYARFVVDGTGQGHTTYGEKLGLVNGGYYPVNLVHQGTYSLAAGTHTIAVQVRAGYTYACSNTNTPSHTTYSRCHLQIMAFY